MSCTTQNNICTGIMVCPWAHSTLYRYSLFALFNNTGCEEAIRLARAKIVRHWAHTLLFIYAVFFIILVLRCFTTYSRKFIGWDNVILDDVFSSNKLVNNHGMELCTKYEHNCVNSAVPVNSLAPSRISRVSCQKGPVRHANAWPIGPFWQDTLDIMDRHLLKAVVCYSPTYILCVYNDADGIKGIHTEHVKVYH